MGKRSFNVSGWILLLGMVVLWIRFGYTDWQLLLLPATYLCFSIGNGKVKKLKSLSVSQIIILVSSFIISVAIAFGLIQLANYLIYDVFHLQGILKTLSEWLAVILSLFPAVIVFSSVINKIDDSLKEKYNDSHTKTSECDGLKMEVNKMLKSMTEMQTFKALRKRYGLSLVDAKNIVDSVK
ncbi:disulfide bond formation protein DsbD [Halobacillus shinanisalinarum]|uniref:Disulfide bond formation protein DsbD n=1 Tax=Halobacillus shinanisalinarum TaxID=2932258 RepID=A0ABY4GXL2_9BACI|nr:disulfide bond formation protein DsbD [Halobacillus shinanisalinarum]UOQ92746.1 disulfide bond formation protein DsbD [Halobacillus shinanisalinarum]